MGRIIETHIAVAIVALSHWYICFSANLHRYHT